MIDLTKINVPFGELVKSTKWSLKGAAGDGETIQFRGNWSPQLWYEVEDPSWYYNTIYRLKPTTPPQSSRQLQE